VTAPTTAREWWVNLTSPHSFVLSKAEEYAALTLPGLLLPEAQNTDTQESSQASGSIGALLVTSLTNKMMMALFAPTRPAQRLEVPADLLAKYLAEGMKASEITDALAAMERDGAKVLNTLAIRPKLYTLITHLIVAGNALLITPKEGEVRVMSLPYFRVKRTIDGRVHTAIIREEVASNELAEDVRTAAGLGAGSDEKKEYYRLIQLQSDGRYLETQWVGDTKLDGKFEALHTDKTLPYNFLTWRRADEANYGTSHCEDFAADLRSAAVLAASTVDGAVIGTEVRWFVAPGGMTKVDDLNASENGDALSGRPEDIGAHQAQNSQAVKIALDVANHWERRLSQAFLFTLNVVRDAERVTAEEIRMLAQELETGLGGVYSTLAVSLQKPLAYWCLDRAGYKIASAKIDVVVITGLDALSRGGDLANLAQALSILERMAALPPLLLQKLDFDAIVLFVGQGVGLDLKPFLLSAAQQQANATNDSATRVAEATATAAGEAAAQGTPA
jgi:hypothetical protein